MKSLVEQGLSREFSFDKNALKTLDEFERSHITISTGTCTRMYNLNV